MLQLPEALGQHGRAHPRQPHRKIGESLRSGEQLAKQEQRPPVTDHVQGKGNRAELKLIRGRGPAAPPAREREPAQRGCIFMRPKTAPCGSLTIAKRPPGKSCGAIISRPPAAVAFWNDLSTLSTLK